ncbi:unnamed protein product, partial [Rotaria magnacalcarata]
MEASEISTLIELNLRKNRIGEIGAEHFREALQINTDNESSLFVTVQMEHEIMHVTIFATVGWTGHQIRNEKLECLSVALETEQSSYSAMLNIPEPVPPPESVPSIPELGQIYTLSESGTGSSDSGIASPDSGITSCITILASQVKRYGPYTDRIIGRSITDRTALKFMALRSVNDTWFGT